MHSKYADTYLSITNTIIEAIESGTRPWMQPWSAASDEQMFNRPLRANGEPYRGINILLLWNASAVQGFEYDRFMTYRQAQQLGGQIRMGEKGTLIVKYGTVARRSEQSGEDEDREQSQKIPYIKSYTVFNLSQIGGLPSEFYTRKERRPRLPEDRLAIADAFIKGTNARIIHGGSMSCYQPRHDLIRLPPFSAFESRESYYTTALHELAHWSGAPHRLDRRQTPDYRSLHYAFEEMVAEITACFLCSDLEITAELRQESAAYIDDWLFAMRSDIRLIFSAAAKAQAAADFLHGLQLSSTHFPRRS